MECLHKYVFTLRIWKLSLFRVLLLRYGEFLVNMSLHTPWIKLLYSLNIEIPILYKYVLSRGKIFDESKSGLEEERDGLYMIFHHFDCCFFRFNRCRDFTYIGLHSATKKQNLTLNIIFKQNNHNKLFLVK